MRDRELVVFALLLKAVIVATPARAAEAQEPGPAEKSLTEKASPSSETGSADDHARRAQSLFKEQRFSDAADELKRAYAQAPNPLFLFNAGQAYRKALRPIDAKDMYERFVAVAPNSPLVPEAKGYVQTLDILIGEQQAKQQAELTLLQEQQAKQRAEENLSQKETELAEQIRRREEAQRQLDRVKNPPLYKKPWFWGLTSGVIVGGAAIAVGVGLGLTLYKTDGGKIVLQY